MSMTPRQLDVVIAVRNFRHLHGYGPTLCELADQLGVSQPTISQHVTELVKKGVLKRDPGKWRSLEIVHDLLPPDDDNRRTKLPLLGNIAA
jgi:repressor LexA